MLASLVCFVCLVAILMKVGVIWLLLQQCWLHNRPGNMVICHQSNFIDVFAWCYSGKKSKKTVKMWLHSFLWLGALVTSALTIAIAIAPASSKMAVPNCVLIVKLVNSARHEF